ncbi:hypothetical protein F5I97DRAFT_1929598 [Phlebopus sp. FC_14]|nr:hypothetical protein F5I97DRAFT_1929598 [Phlebopus sp. FC_14]
MTAKGVSSLGPVLRQWQVLQFKRSSLFDLIASSSETMLTFGGPLDSTVLIICAFVAIALLLSGSSLWKSRNTTGLPYPPGPKPLPLLGNILQIDMTQPWLSYTKWARRYGDILYVRLLGLDFIILNSEKAGRDLLDRRSTIYSDRPLMPTYKLFGMDFNSVMFLMEIT